jgi:hypothetical protein
MACPKYRNGKNCERINKYNPPPTSKISNGKPQAKDEKAAVKSSKAFMRLKIMNPKLMVWDFFGLSS